MDVRLFILYTESRKYAMNIEKIGFIGLGLIGGSIAKTLKRVCPQIKLYATSGHQSTVTQAYEAHIIENSRQLPLSELADMDYLFLCTPVRQNLEYLAQLKGILSPRTVITDVGSVKGDIHRAVIRLGMEDCFIGGHPMAGSEKTGFAAATPYLLENAYYVITPTSATTGEQLARFKELVSMLGAIPLVLDYDRHDFATASISHLPHIIAYSLVNLVKNIDDADETMKTIAAGGFRDMTRIAASSPVMWQDICLSNREQLLNLIDLYSQELSSIRHTIEAEDKTGMAEYFTEAKNYRDSLSIRKKSSIQPVYELYCDLIDEVGGIATLATLLASNGINIKNIGILHNREFEDGVLHIELYDSDSLNTAANLLTKYHYTVYRR